MKKNTEQKESKINEPVLYEKLGMADYDNELFRLKITLETVDKSNKPVHALAALRLNEEPLSYLELLNVIPILYGALYDEGTRCRAEQKALSHKLTENSLVWLDFRQRTATHLGHVFESLTEITDSLKLDYSDSGEIENRICK